MGSRERDRDLELLIPVAATTDNVASKSSPSSPSSSSSHHHSGREAFSKVIRSWASKKFMSGCVILLPIAITFYITWGFFHFVDGFFSPVYNQLGINVFGKIPEVILNLGSNELDGILPSILICAEPGIKRMFPNQFIFCLGFITSITFIFLVGVFMSSWLGASLLGLGEWFIKKMPLVSYIYSASKQISAAISPDQSSNAFKEVAIIRHPRIGEYAFGFITNTVLLQRNTGEEELCCIYVPSNHLYIGDVFLISSMDILRPNLSVREGIEIVISGGMSVPQILTTIDAQAIPASRIGNLVAAKV
ncbi:Protein like COV 3 [Vitis vinifera]|uniref:Protein like COV 3 n=1 Tax=Vitis vinifera TaxID=29760 RepID=A0A438K1V8_VITVI|nr:Protein like COV 3 [Vitis vinifera]